MTQVAKRGDAALVTYVIEGRGAHKLYRKSTAATDLHVFDDRGWLRDQQLS